MCCFSLSCSINAFSDTKAKFGMTIFTKDDSLQIGFDCEEDRDMWLSDMRLLSHTSQQSRSIVRKSTAINLLFSDNCLTMSLTEVVRPVGYTRAVVFCSDCCSSAATNFA